jgi:phosphatidylserine/phosphatidylglycerophosphate/cardiolipin synthase-like enzyme
VAELRAAIPGRDDEATEVVPWTSGNDVRPLIHGVTYFRELLHVVNALGPGDLLLFADWRGDPDEQLDGPGTEVGAVFAGAARRGADVRGLIWRSHLDRFQFSAKENRHLGTEIEAAGGQCLLDMRVRPMGSHHQKLVVVRHRDRPSEDVAFVGGIDLCHSRRDDARHLGDPQRQPMSAVYGERPPWHDAQVELRGPAVGQAEEVFRERWEDPAPLSRNPVHLIGERLFGEDRTARPLPPRRPDPPRMGNQSVQLLRTYPVRHPGYPFAPSGNRSIAHAYAKVLGRARSLVYIEDQYLWSGDVARVFARALASNPELRMIAVIPGCPDQDGRISLPPNLVGREKAVSILTQAAGDRFAVYSLENENGTPIYVHSKVCIVDDSWACVGSDNTNRRSWTHDSELSAAVVDEGGTWPRNLRLQLANEHLGAAAGVDDLADPAGMFRAFADSARRLDAWCRDPEGERPPGQLRTYRPPKLSAFTKAWSTPLYRLLYDPDGRDVIRRIRGRY